MAHSFNSKVLESEEERVEREHFDKVVRTFKHYKKYCIERVVKAQNDFHQIPERHKKMVPSFLPHLAKIRTCIEHNYEIIKLILQHTDNMFENKSHEPIQDTDSLTPVSHFDMVKVKTTLRQLVRDWSIEGQEERESSYKPIVNELLKRFPPDECDTTAINVLVPGAGLGRLCFDIASKGYTCQGNEVSLFMLFASNFILNRSMGTDSLTVYPWVHNYCNNRAADDQIRPIHVPDVDPSFLPSSAMFSMAAGDFLEIYTDPESWDCVATCYFIDTANNILAYIETIYKILKPGGYWINLGPLLYHFADTANESSLELSYDVLRGVILNFGFEIVDENLSVQSTYTHNKLNMLKYEYSCVFLVCRKPDRPQSNGTAECSS
ncbi:carnosine N-methyltransferase-like [Glandiceps talaboti]